MLKKIKNIIINFDFQHPAVQGILSLLIDLVGETVVRVDPHKGYDIIYLNIDNKNVKDIELKKS